MTESRYTNGEGLVFVVKSFACPPFIADLLMHAKVEQQKLAKQLSQPAMAVSI